MTETDDSPEARLAAARRFMAAMPIIEDMMNQGLASAPTLSEAQRERCQVAWGARKEMLEEIVIESYVRFMTAGELDAAARFHASPEGRAMRRKAPEQLAYMLQRLQPLIIAVNEEVLRD